MDSKGKTKQTNENADISGSVVHGHVEPLESSGEQVIHHSDKWKWNDGVLTYLPVGHRYGSHPNHVITLKFDCKILRNIWGEKKKESSQM